MTPIKANIYLSVAFLPLLLTGCGKGWVAQPYHGTPYGDRTAGSGVEYVRAHMDPPATLNRAPTPPPAPAPAPAPAAAPVAPVTSAAPVFHKAVEK